MIVKALLLLIFSSCSVLADQHVTLELNVPNENVAVSNELNFANSRVYTHDVNPGYYVDNVTQGGLTVWRSPRTGYKITNAMLVLNELGPRLVSLTLSVKDNESHLLYYLYTLEGWVNLNDVNPFNIRLDVPESERTSSPLALTNGEEYFDKPNTESDSEVPVPESVNLDLEDQLHSKFEFKFNYSNGKYTYYYRPRKGYLVKNVKEGKTLVWRAEGDQVLSYVVAEKKEGRFVAVHVTYLESDLVKDVSYTRVSKTVWTSSSTNETKKFDPSQAAKNVLKTSEMAEALKPGKKLVSFDLNDVPESPLCRKCTYDVDGLMYNTVYLSQKSDVRLVFDHEMLVFDVPREYTLDNLCFYTKNDKIVMVDVMTHTENKTTFFFLEKTPDGYRRIEREAFHDKLKKFMERPVLLDISKPTDGVRKTTQVKGQVEYHIFAPSDGYVIRKVVDGDLFVIETASDILEVVVNYLDGEKRLLSVFYRDGPNFNYDYFTYSDDMGKWTRISEYFHYTLIDQFIKVKPTRYPILDIKQINKSNKFVYVRKDEFHDHYVFTPRPGVNLSSVYDYGRFVWTARYPGENCTFVWFQYKANLLYLISKDNMRVRHYRYQRDGGKWSVLSEDEFNKRFDYLYSKNLTADFRNDLPGEFDVREFGNALEVTPRGGYMVTRVRYGDKLIWVGSEDLKCTSFKVIFGRWDTYLHLDLMDSKYHTSKQYYSTVSGDMFKWRVCDPIPEEAMDDSDSEPTRDGAKVKFSRVGKDPDELSDSGNEGFCEKEKLPPVVEDLGSEEGVPKDPSEGDRVIVTNVNPNKEQTPETDLSSDTTEVINGIPLRSGSTVNFTPGVLNDSDMPIQLEYLTGKRTMPKSLPYEEKLALTLEPDSVRNERSNKKNAQKKQSEPVDSNKSDGDDLSHSRKRIKLDESERTPAQPVETPEPSDNSKAESNKDSFSELVKEAYQNVDLNSESAGSPADSKPKSPDSLKNLAMNSFSDLVKEAYASPDAGSDGEKSSPTPHSEPQEKPKENETVPSGSGTKTYINGLMYLQDLRSADFGEFRDARPNGFNFLLFTPRPGFPIRDLRDGFETIWVSSTDECLALSVYVKDGFPSLLELFIKNNVDVFRKHFQMIGDRWRQITPEKYDVLTSKPKPV